MKKLLLLVFSLSIFCDMYTQNAPGAIQGEYYLKGVMETASGFRFNPDSTFDFFFSQGALDRYGKGKFKQEGNKLILNSLESHELDFKLVNSKKEPGKTTVVRITDPNQNILRYVFVKIKSGNETKEAFVDSQGYFKYEGNKPDSIQLMFEFCPEKISSFPVASIDHNYFEFNFEQWLFEYFFNNFTLDFSNGELNGRHPLLEGNKFRYVKQENEAE